MKSIKIPLGCDYMMKIEFSDIKTGRCVERELFYNESTDEFSQSDDSSSIIFINRNVFDETLKRFKNLKIPSSKNEAIG